MANHSYSVEVQSDFLEKITRAKPIQAMTQWLKDRIYMGEQAVLARAPAERYL